MNRLHAACLLSFLAAGCAASPPQGDAASAARQNCHVEYRVGSSLPVKECEKPMTEAERQSAEAERQRAVDEVRNAVRPPASPPSSGRPQ